MQKKLTEWLNHYEKVESIQVVLESCRITVQSYKEVGLKKGGSDKKM